MDSPFVPSGYLLTTRDFNLSRAISWESHDHPEHELLWSDGGIVRLEADGRVWTIPPALGVWIPANVPHKASTDGPARVRATYFVEVAGNSTAMPPRVLGVAMTEPLKVLLTHNLQGNLSDAARLRLQRVILDLLVPAPQATFDLVMPQSAHLRSIADAILASPANKRTTAEWAYEYGMHARTLARQFSAETGESFSQWRILARMQRAIQELTRGKSVVSISRTLGYRSPSTFIDHFRDLTGQTPAEYLRSANSANHDEDVPKP